MVQLPSRRRRRIRRRRRVRGADVLRANSVIIFQRQMAKLRWGESARAVPHKLSPNFSALCLSFRELEKKKRRSVGGKKVAKESQKKPGKSRVKEAREGRRRAQMHEAIDLPGAREKEREKKAPLFPPGLPSRRECVCVCV